VRLRHCLLIEFDKGGSGPRMVSSPSTLPRRLLLRSSTSAQYPGAHFKKRRRFHIYSHFPCPCLSSHQKTKIPDTLGMLAVSSTPPYRIPLPA
jgi:hypothetical protein